MRDIVMLFPDGLLPFHINSDPLKGGIESIWTS